MNYKKILLAAVCMASVPALAQKPCKIDGEVMKGASAEKVYVYIENDNGGFGDNPDDSVVVKNGKFSYTSTLKEIRQVYFIAQVREDKSMTMPTYLVPGEKGTLSFNENSYYMNGSKFYKEWNNADLALEGPSLKLNALRDSIMEQIEKMSEDEQRAKLPELVKPYQQLALENQKAEDAYLKAHGSEAGCVMFFLNRAGNANAITSLATFASDNLKGSLYDAYMQKQLAAIKVRQEAEQAAEAEAKAAEDATGEGKMFVDFEAEYNGKIQKLSDYVGKGKYVLVDFWASWCGPCKAEIPNLIAAHNKYKGDKFTVLGVATWDKPRDTEKAIEQMQIPYPQIMNAQKAGSDAYGILGIPQIILFGPDGTIVKRNLRGAVIEETLKGIFGE
ncbi:MAG: AhpC/TSA family protein [Bacteroidales bacterium]|nr:AhpC/TSA family protein [Bacteroidales bacterium]